MHPRVLGKKIQGELGGGGGGGGGGRRGGAFRKKIFGKIKEIFKKFIIRAFKILKAVTIQINMISH